MGCARRGGRRVRVAASIQSLFAWREWRRPMSWAAAAWRVRQRMRSWGVVEPGNRQYQPERSPPTV